MPMIDKKDVRVYKDAAHKALFTKNEKTLLGEPRLSKEDLEIINDVVNMKALADVTYEMGEPDGTNSRNRCS